jgi:hypothetical protein
LCDRQDLLFAGCVSTMRAGVEKAVAAPPGPIQPVMSTTTSVRRLA